jgi:hypothetical protein
MAFDSSNYKDYLLYNLFLNENKGKIENLELIKRNINEINNNCVNKDFIFILLFEKWVNEEHISVYKGESENKVNYKKNPNDISFNDFEIYPFYKSGDKYLDILPIFNIAIIFKILNSLNNEYVPNIDLDDYYTIIENKLPKIQTIKGLDIDRVDLYVDKGYKQMESVSAGLYPELLYKFEHDKEEHLVTFDKKQNNFKGADLIKSLTTNISALKIKTESDLNSLAMCIKINNDINIASFKAISLFNSILNMITVLATQLDKNVPPNLVKIKKDYISSFYRIDELIKDQKITPAFKKAYVVRENNLTAYIKIKILYHLSKGSNYFEINNFNVPYNNILGLEHDVNSQKITLSLIDTEGDLSSLLIYKMYQISEKNAIVPTDGVDADQPYTFQIEYGWAGPITEDEEEMLEQRVYTKKNYIGFITSITSQFTMKGVEYKLTIAANNNQLVNSNHNYYDFLYNKDGFFISSIILFYILKYSTKDFANSHNNVFDLSSGKVFDKDTFLLEKIFFYITTQKSSVFIEKIDKDNFTFTKIVKVGENIHKRLLTDSINRTNDSTFFIFLEKLVAGVNLQKDQEVLFNNKATKINIYDTDLIQIDDLKNAMGDLTSDFRLNGWLMSVFLIWRLKIFFSDKNEPYILHDTVGLFDIFDSNNVFIQESDFFQTINKFNLFCFKNETTVNSNNIFDVIKQTINDKKLNDFNQFNLGSLHPNSYESSKISLTFFTKKIDNIFNSIKNIGLNKQSDGNNIYQFANGVNSDFMSYKDIDKNYFETIKKEYQKKIYGIKNLIYKSSVTSNEDKRDEDSFAVFEEKLKKDILTKAKKYQIDPQENNFISEIEKKESNLINSNTNTEPFKSILDMFHILFLHYDIDKNKLLKGNTISFVEKIANLSKNVVQSYSLMPRIRPKTRNSNKQFFSQGNNAILDEGTGDIIDFQVDEFEVSKFNALMVSNKNKKNIGFASLVNNDFIKAPYENAAKYYNTYINIDGQVDIKQITQDMANLELTYQNQLNLSANITIIGEPYWSDNVHKNKFIYLNIFYNSGMQSNHSGLYTVKGVTQTIENNKFTTKIDLLRMPTFLNNFNNLAESSNTDFLIKL